MKKPKISERERILGYLKEEPLHLEMPFENNEINRMLEEGCIKVVREYNSWYGRIYTMHHIGIIELV